MKKNIKINANLTRYNVFSLVLFGITESINGFMWTEFMYILSKMNEKINTNGKRENLIKSSTVIKLNIFTLNLSQYPAIKQDDKSKEYPIERILIFGKDVILVLLEAGISKSLF